MKQFFAIILLLYAASNTGASNADYYFFHSPVLLSDNTLLVSYKVYSEAVGGRDGWYKDGLFLVDTLENRQLILEQRYEQLVSAGQPGSYFIINRHSILLLQIDEEPVIRVLYSLSVETAGNGVEITDFRKEDPELISFSLTGIGTRQPRNTSPRRIVLEYKSGLLLEDGIGRNANQNTNQAHHLNFENPFFLMKNEDFTYFIHHDNLVRTAFNDSEEEVLSPVLFFGTSNKPGQENAVSTPAVYDSSLTDSGKQLASRKNNEMSFASLQEYVKRYFESAQTPPDLPVRSLANIDENFNTETNSSLGTINTINTFNTLDDEADDTKGTLYLRFQSPYLNYLVKKFNDGTEEVLIPRTITFGP